MKYFRIKDAFQRKDRWYLGTPKTKGGLEVDPRLFTDGKEYRGECNLEIPIRRGSHALDFTLGSFDMPVVVPRLAEHLQACCGDAIQLVPSNIAGGGLAVEILNVLKVLDAIDEEHSEITRWTEDDSVPAKVGTYAGIGKIVLRKEKISDAVIFRLRNWELPLIVNEKVKDTLESMHSTGVVFQELDVV